MHAALASAATYYLITTSDTAFGETQHHVHLSEAIQGIAEALRDPERRLKDEVVAGIGYLAIIAVSNLDILQVLMVVSKLTRENDRCRTSGRKSARCIFPL